MTHHIMVMDKLPGREKLDLGYSLIEILVVKFHSSSTELILFSWTVNSTNDYDAWGSWKPAAKYISANIALFLRSIKRCNF